MLRIIYIPITRTQPPPHFVMQSMKKHGVTQMVFSSSCTVYGDPEHLPIREDHPTGNVTNVYGRTKYLIEEMLKDLSRADPVSL